MTMMFSAEASAKRSFQTELKRGTTAAAWVGGRPRHLAVFWSIPWYRSAAPRRVQAESLPIVSSAEGDRVV